MTKEEWLELAEEDRTCEACNFDTSCKEYNDRDKVYMLCEVCANTYFSRPYTQDHRLSVDLGQLFISLAWAFNRVLSDTANISWELGKTKALIVELKEMIKESKSK